MKTETWNANKIVRTLEENSTYLRKLGVLKIGLFGSYRRNNPSEDSDIDILVKLEQQSFDAYMDVKIYLEDLFGCKVDLVIEETVKPRLRPYITSEVYYASGF
jgi:predicted nucleotidyltransferase